MALPTLTLNDDRTLPQIGFGTYPLRGRDGCQTILQALRTGYRLIDSAQNYDNEACVGQAIRRSGVARQEIFVQTKLAGRFHAYDKARRMVVESLWRLGLDYIDVMLIHWPNPSAGLYVEAYAALAEAQREGLIRSIGVSNFGADHLQQIIDQVGIVPAVNQIELHPHLAQTELRQLHGELGIVTQAWSPLGRGRLPDETNPLIDAAQNHGKSVQQVALRWHLQIGSLPLPKATTAERQQANLEVFDFELTEAEIEAITAWGTPGERIFGTTPYNHEEM